jgi:hypothetical protein
MVCCGSSIPAMHQQLTDGFMKRVLTSLIQVRIKRVRHHFSYTGSMVIDKRSHSLLLNAVHAVRFMAGY